MSEETKKENNLIENWFKNPDYSPGSYPFNSIIDIVIDGKNIIVIYKDIIHSMWTGISMEERSGLYIPVGMINAIPDDMQIVFINADDEYVEDIILYGDTFINKDNLIDTEYEVFTEKTLRKISPLTTKFKNISLSCQFNSYKDMLYLIESLYDLLSTKEEDSSVTLYASSCLPSKKDGNFFVTIADAISNEEIPSYIAKDLKYNLFLDFSKLVIFDVHQTEEYGDDYTRYTSFED